MLEDEKKDSNSIDNEQDRNKHNLFGINSLDELLFGKKDKPDLETPGDNVFEELIPYEELVKHNSDNIENNGTFELEHLLIILKSLKRGDLTLRMPLEYSNALEKEVIETLNDIIDINAKVASGVITISKELGAEGKLGAQASTEGLEGLWLNVTDSVNMMSLILSTQLRAISKVALAVAGRDMTKKITVDAFGEMLQVKNTINNMVDQLQELEVAIKKLTSSVNN